MHFEYTTFALSDGSDTMPVVNTPLKREQTAES